jgi:biopolymer transport protein ExbD
MKVPTFSHKTVRIEMLPLIDIVFLLLVVFIYAMLSMAVHRGLPVTLPTSKSAPVQKPRTVAVTIQADGSLFVDKRSVLLTDLVQVLKNTPPEQRRGGVVLFADRDLTYQSLFQVLDQIRAAGVERISMQAVSGEQE